jgi:hypothetical protein
MIPVQEFVDAMLRVAPFIFMGAFTGWMCGKTNIECHEDISRIHGRYAEITQDVLRITSEATAQFSELNRTCMRNDRFEFVDIKKEEK